MRTRTRDTEPYVTKDGSTIRELLHPAVHTGPGGPKAQSLAEATVPPGVRTHAHRHEQTEEFYYVLRGTGRMRLDSDAFDVSPGEAICIPPGTVHDIENTGLDDLVILCCCTPPYSHGDTELE